MAEQDFERDPLSSFSGHYSRYNDGHGHHGGGLGSRRGIPDRGAAATSSAGRRAPAAERQAGAAAAPRPCLRGWSEEERHLFSERRDGPGGGPALERATLASQRGRSSWLSRASRQGSAECPCTVSERACRAPAVRTCLSLGRARWNGSRRGQRPRAAPAHHEGCRAAAQPPAAGPKRPGPLAISRGGCGEQGGRRGPERGSLESAPGPRVFCRAELTTGSRREARR
ncbi:unnamed protein product [Prorocentrum cordatum]|uniref:Uncharacterized protein n=1 Tax=Prorocentrum cordatum TaxID=2364126 RepID=A0ABN9RJ36_9DINO|nr:unnamed protein product [Polarella glacialis]